ncbi:MAG: ATP-binding protein [Ignavibacteria bacterium]
MSRRSLLWVLSFPYLLLIIISITIFGYYSLKVFEENLLPEIITVGLFILIIASLLGIAISRKISTPLMEMKKSAESFASGDFEKKIYPSKVGELKSLSDSLNLMAEDLDEKIKTISEQRNIRQTVLESMREGVIAVDYNERILLINKTAESILDIKEKNIKGKTLQEVVRIYDIQKFFKKVLTEKNPQETELIIKEENDKILQLSGTPLYESEDTEIGVLVVLNDVTELKHLDNLKRDFVANVSHELKTPITTIKGFIETLREGALNEPKNARRFLEIVSKHTDRLNVIIEDLLSLSRLEQKSSVMDIKFIAEQIKTIINSVIDDFELKARDKNIKINLECENNLTVKVNRPLIEEAVGNLLDNAIKYSDKKSGILISSYVDDEFLTISVKDEGPGISDEHLTRLFERFYRVDKARSRDAGGTGLGLAIVKHIAQVHGGTASVKSKLGKGSIFTIKIPKNLES